MAEAITESIAILAKYFFIWVIVGLIVTGLSLRWVVLTGGFVDISIKDSSNRTILPACRIMLFSFESKGERINRQ